jgi:hypothetical protein
MEESCSWETNFRSAAHEIPAFFWKIYFCILHDSLLGTITGQPNSFLIYLCNIHFTIQSLQTGLFP